MMVDKRLRIQQLVHSPLRLYPNSDELRALFAQRSYAIVRYDNSGRVNRLRWFVPIIPRHMSPNLWRLVFWHDPVSVVIMGREYKSLCSMCSNIMLCLRQNGHTFVCKFNKHTSTVNMGTGDERD